MNSYNFRARGKTFLSINLISKKRGDWLLMTILDSAYNFLPNLQESKIAHATHNDGQRRSSFPDEARDNIHPQVHPETDSYRSRKRG